MINGNSPVVINVYAGEQKPQRKFRKSKTVVNTAKASVPKTAVQTVAEKRRASIRARRSAIRQRRLAMQRASAQRRLAQKRTGRR